MNNSRDRIGLPLFQQLYLLMNSKHKEHNKCRVFSERILRLAIFRRVENRITNKDEDIVPDFAKDQRPNLFKVLKYFREDPDSSELCLETLLNIHQFKMEIQSSLNKKHCFIKDDCQC